MTINIFPVSDTQFALEVSGVSFPTYAEYRTYVDALLEAERIIEREIVIRRMQAKHYG